MHSERRDCINGGVLCRGCARCQGRVLPSWSGAIQHPNPAAPAVFPLCALLSSLPSALQARRLPPCFSSSLFYPVILPLTSLLPYLFIMAPKKRATPASTRGQRSRSPADDAVESHTPVNETASMSNEDLRAQIERTQLLNQLRFEEERLRQQELETEKRQLEIRLLNKQLEAPTAGSTPTPADDEQGEVLSPAVTNILDSIHGIPPAQVQLIATHKFLPENLYRLRRHREKAYLDEKQVLEYDTARGTVALKRPKASRKDYGSNPSIWSECFLSYVRLVHLLFVADHPRVPAAMLEFHHRIIFLASTYEWSAVLELALSYHVFVAAKSILDPEPWDNLPDRWVAEYCTADTARPAKRPRPNPTDKDKDAPRGEKTSACVKFNAGHCSSRDCTRRHECLICKASSHGASSCPKKQ